MTASWNARLRSAIVVVSLAAPYGLVDTEIERHPNDSAAGAPRASSQDSLAQLRNALRNLMAAQEAYFADHKTYSTKLDTAAGLRFSDIPAVTTSLTYAAPNGWAAVAEPAKPKGVSCVVWVGSVPNPSQPRTRRKQASGSEGVVTCD